MAESATSSNMLARIWRYASLFIQRPDDIASLVPSSRYLNRQLASLECINTARAIAELGPGDGGITRELLREMQPDARLLAIELLEDMMPALHSIPDDRLIAEHSDAGELTELVSRHDLGSVDVVVSGIPFSNLKPDHAAVVVEAVFQSLKPGGTFVAYQLRDQINGLALERFGEPETSFVPWNFPPLRLFQWNKPAQSEHFCAAGFFDQSESSTFSACIADA